MNAREIKALIKVLRTSGVTRFKSADFEIEMGSSNQGDCANPLNSNRLVRSQPPQPIKDPEPDEPIKHKVEELTSLLKLSDVDLVDSLFPDHSNAADEVEA